MSGTQLWLLASLAFASLTSLTDGAPLKVMSAPNLLRVGTAEKVFVECQDCSGGDQRVEIIVMNHPTKTKRLTSTTVTLTAANNFQQFGQITVPAADFSKDPNLKQYVYLQAQFPDQLLEKVVLVSFQSGYIFIQTDKTIYTPDTSVYYRLFAVTPQMEPVETTEPDDYVDVTIVTPDNIILPLQSVILKSEIVSGAYQLGEFPSLGRWKVVAKFYKQPQHSYSAEFEVKEYVLPSFEVKLTPGRSFFCVDIPELHINIKATYLFGEEVEGAAYVFFGAMQDGQKKSFPSSLQRVMIENGNGAVRLRREHITQTFPDILRLVGSSIYVSVSVITDNGGEMVEAELRGIQIVTSRYTMNFRRTPKYFKPGMPFDVTVEVLNPDETPARGVPVVVDPGNVNANTGDNGIAKLTINTVAGIKTLSITAKTNYPFISRERQAQATMDAQPYVTSSKNYMYIQLNRGGETELHLGDRLIINLGFNMQSTESSDITYLILSRGQLRQYGRYNRRGQVIVSLVVPITKDMLPSFRIVAYYHPSDNEVVSDSVWVDVKDTCMGSLKLETTRPAPSYMPRKMFGLKVTGDPEATVGLVAVDKGVYVLNNQHRLTQKKIWDVVEKYDTGCTPGGGKDSMGVFYDAGLVFESSAGSGTPHRQELNCPSPSRRKRDTTLTDYSLGDDSYMDSDEIVTRTQSPESWLWKNIKLPACPRQNPNCASTSYEERVLLPESITTWQFTGISLSRTQGICVGDPLEVIVRKDFFIDLRLPYAAVRGEQLEVKAILHNYTPDTITVRVDMIEVESICNAAYKRGRYRQELNLGPQNTASVSFIIIPMKEGQFRIEVKAAVKHSSLADGIAKMLQVVPEGVLLKAPQVLVLDPSKKGAGGKQEVILNSAIPEKDLVPNTRTKTHILITVAEYWTSAKEQDYELNVDVLLPGETRPRPYTFNRENHFKTRATTFNDINQDVKVTASGSGEATLTMVSYYYALPKEKESDCQKFDMSVKLTPVKQDDEDNIYTLTIEVLYKDKTHDATMSILDIGLLTGFTVNTDDLDALSKGRARIISKYEMNTVLSERGSLIIYLDKVSHTRPEEISFRLHQNLKVGVSQPAAVSVYEYYDPKRCVKFYSEKPDGEVKKLCINNVCICAEEQCVTRKKGRISSAERFDKCCESTPFSKTDFAYKVRLEGLSTDNYTMQVLEVIKKECDDAAPESKLHIFFSFPQCRNVLDVQKGKTYLIMGTSRDIFSDDQSQSYQYVLGERTWIEYWPTEAECQTVEHRTTCIGLKEMVLQYNAFGCPE